MTWRANLILAFLGLAVAAGVAQFQPFPGYLDSDYYFAGGVELARGHGFSEPYLWNYLDDPPGLPHDSHSYWMPLASLLAAAGMRLSGQTSYAAGRAGFLVLAAVVPVTAAALAHALSRRRDLAFASGLLGAFPVYYAPFLPVPDNYGLYIVLGGMFLVALGWRSAISFPVLGLLAGAMTLARTDGVLWLGLGAIAALRGHRRPTVSETPGVEASDEEPHPEQRPNAGLRTALTIGGFLLVAGPWLIRNWSLFGTLLPPGGSHVLWLTSYDETFIYPAGQLTYARWIAQGLPSILSARLAALRWNLLNAFAAQGSIFLLPFVALGAWALRRDFRIQLGLLGWTCLLFVMTAVFPFAGARGGFFHAGAGFQSLWWALAPLGLENTVAVARRRGLFTDRAPAIFRGALVGIAVLMTAVIVAIRVLPGWGEGEQVYPQVDAFLQQSGAQEGEIVMIRNPPGYYMLTERPAIVVPYADAAGILAVARRYDARYIVIETAGAAGPIRAVYEKEHSEMFDYLGELDGTRIFRIRQ